jgi:hypothetical protein
MLSATPDLLISGIILIAFLAVLHASFQLATSVLTLISGHSLMHERAKHRLLTLNVAYILGVVAMTSLVIAGMATSAVLWLPLEHLDTAWLLLITVALVVGLLVMTAYYRRGKGTRLWIPRSFASYLEDRAKKTKNVVEAGALGIISVVAELPFTAVLMAMASLVLASFVMLEDFVPIIALYCTVATLPLVTMTILLAGGHKLSRIQRWRENSKLFLQYAAGAGMFAATVYAWVNFVLLGGAV